MLLKIERFFIMALQSTSLVNNFSNIQEAPPAKWDLSSHQVFLTTNETNQQPIQEMLLKLDKTGNTAIGVSSFQVLNFASIRKDDYVVVFDRGIRVDHFWQKAAPIIAKSENRGKCYTEIAKLIEDNYIDFYAATKADAERIKKECAEGNFGSALPLQQKAEARIQSLREEIESGLSWLSTEERFKIIQAIFQNDRFVFKRIDLFQPKTFRNIQEIFQTQNMVPDVVYLSNLWEYTKWEANSDGMRLANLCLGMIETVKTLTTPETCLIDTEPRECHDCKPLSQRVRMVNSLPEDEFEWFQDSTLKCDACAKKIK